MKNNKPTPYYYCPKCKQNTEKIIQIYHTVKEYRFWNGEEYELTSTSLEEPSKIICQKCKNTVTEA